MKSGKFKKIIIASILMFSFVACRESKALSLASKNDGEISSETSKTVLFGNYPQKTKNAEPIKWTVIDSDADKVLLLSNECIESLPWHKTCESITWDKSDIINTAAQYKILAVL